MHALLKIDPLNFIHLITRQDGKEGQQLNLSLQKMDINIKTQNLKPFGHGRMILFLLTQ